MGSYNIYRYIEGMNIHDRPVAYSSDFEIGMIKELRVKFSSAHTVEDFDFVSHKMSSKKKYDMRVLRIGTKVTRR